MLADAAGLPAREGQVGEQTLVLSARREGDGGKLITEVGLSERRNLQASRKSSSVKLLEACPAGCLKGDDVLAVTVPVAE